MSTNLARQKAYAVVVVLIRTHINDCLAGNCSDVVRLYSTSRIENRAIQHN